MVQPATARETPYIWITWLAKVMTGDMSCQWAYWFQAHHKLETRTPSSFDATTFKIKHSKALNEQIAKAQSGGPAKLSRERKVEWHFVEPHLRGATISGKIDLLVETPSERLVVDCKTGQPRNEHEAQVMLYQWMLRREDPSDSRPIRGRVVYADHAVEIGPLSPRFDDDVVYFVGLLASASAALRVPGDDCRFCPITRLDCPERREERVAAEVSPMGALPLFADVP